MAFSLGGVWATNTVGTAINTPAMQKLLMFLASSNYKIIFQVMKNGSPNIKNMVYVDKGG
jgi:hypothetical protein